MFIISTVIVSTVVSADFTIEQVLPENTIAFASVENVSELVDQLQKMGACDMVCDMAQSFIASEGSDGESCAIMSGCPDLEACLKGEGEFSLPTGQAGWGLYPVVDFETGTVGLGMLAMLEIGKSNMAEMMQGAFDGHAKANNVEIETVDISGRQVYVVQSHIQKAQAQLPIAVDLSSLSQMYFASTDGYLLFGTDPEGFSNLFSALDGEPIDDSLATNAIYDEFMTRCGSDGDVIAGVILTNLADTLMQMDTSGMGMMIMPMVKSLLGDWDGLAETVDFSPSEDVLLTGKYALVMQDGRNGIMGLLGEDAPTGDIPSFVGEDTISYMQSNVDFSKVVPLLKDVVAGNPMLAYQMNPQMMEQMEAGLAMYLSTLGSETHFMTTGTAPFSFDQIGYLAAVECVNEEALSNVLSMMMPAMGASPTDFLGNQIFTIDLGGGMMMPMPMDLSISIAVGGGYIFVGSQHSVENSLRAIANPKDARSNHGLSSATSMVDHADVSSWGYGDMAKSMEMQIAMSNSMSSMHEEMLAQVAEFDPEMAAEMRADADQSRVLQDALLNALANMFGPMAWSMHADDTGFSAEVIMLKSEK
jgi:hypothetical protein